MKDLEKRVNTLELQAAKRQKPQAASNGIDEFSASLDAIVNGYTSQEVEVLLSSLKQDTQCLPDYVDPAPVNGEWAVIPEVDRVVAESLALQLSVKLARKQFSELKDENLVEVTGHD